MDILIINSLMVLNLVVVNYELYRTLDSSPYTITELLLLLQQLPIASVARLIW